MLPGSEKVKAPLLFGRNSGQRQAAAVRMFLRFFGLRMLAFQIDERADFGATRD
jgi:hypothetical protein